MFKNGLLTDLNSFHWNRSDWSHCPCDGVPCVRCPSVSSMGYFGSHGRPHPCHHSATSSLWRCCCYSCCSATVVLLMFCWLVYSIRVDVFLVGIHRLTREAYIQLWLSTHAYLHHTTMRRFERVYGDFGQQFCSEIRMV